MSSNNLNGSSGIAHVPTVEEEKEKDHHDQNLQHQQQLKLQQQQSVSVINANANTNDDANADANANTNDDANDNSSRLYKRKQNGRSSRRRKAKLRAIAEAEAQYINNDDSTQQQQQQQQQQSDETAQQSIPVPDVPMDRSNIWPGLLPHRSLEKSEEALLIGQLGFLPGNALQVAARIADLDQNDSNHQTIQQRQQQQQQQQQQQLLLLSSKNSSSELEPVVITPIVLRLYPIAVREAYAGGKVDGRKYKFKSRKRGPSTKPAQHTSLHNETTKTIGDDSTAPTESTTIPEAKHHPFLIEPFPTLYWLTHPLLRTLVSKLELSDHFNSRILEQRLSNDPTSLQRMKRAHSEYGKERWGWLTPQDRAEIDRRRWTAALNEERGIAGIRKPIAVKCLHAHVAHYLSGGKGSKDNVVGEWVWREVEKMMGRIINEKNEKKLRDQTRPDQTTQQ